MKLDFTKQIRKMAENKVDEIKKIWLEKLKKNTPEDTFELQEHNQVSDTITIWDTTKARIFNDDPKVKYVEYSITPKNYYKNSWRRNGGTPFMGWNGAGMFRKTRFYLENN